MHRCVKGIADTSKTDIQKGTKITCRLAHVLACLMDCSHSGCDGGKMTSRCLQESELKLKDCLLDVKCVGVADGLMEGAMEARGRQDALK